MLENRAESWPVAWLETVRESSSKSMQPNSALFKQGIALLVAGILWLGIVITGFTLLMREEFTPVPSTSITSQFPPSSGLLLSDKKPTLVLFLHPHCPCSCATLHELEQLLGQTQDKLVVRIVFTIPPGTPPDWEKGDLLTAADAIPGTSVVRDENAAATRQFGVTGSGHALLYSPDGHLLFSGGITGSRGEEGENPGEMAIVNFVLHGHSNVTRTPVFGCMLL